jgi:hypothetical protein
VNAFSNPRGGSSRNAVGGRLGWTRLRIGAVAVIVGLSAAGAFVAPAARPSTRGPSAEQVPPPAPPEKTAAKTKAVVPFVMLPTNHMLVEARINGKGPFRLLFDLGAPITLLSNRASEAADVVKPDAPRAFIFGMRGEAVVERLEIGELVVAKLPVIVLDHPVLKALSEATDREIDGLVGFTFFARYKTTIDYHGHQMTFEPIDYQVRDLIKDLPERLLAPKLAQQKFLAPAGLWGLKLGEPSGSFNSPGIPIVKVRRGSPADRAGLKAGDILNTLDGRWTTSIPDVFRAAAAVAPGRVVDVVIRRGEEEITLRVVPASGA